MNKGTGYPTESLANFKTKTISTNYLEIGPDDPFFEG